MTIKERLKQQLGVDGASRKEASPRQIAEAIGKEEMSLSRGLRLYDVTEKVKEEKLKGSRKNTKFKQRN
jgi:hypothetical protein